MPENYPHSARADASLHVVNQALRRGTLSMGREEVRRTKDPGRGHWDSLLEFVEEALETLRNAVGATHRNSRDDLANDFHVIVSTTSVQVHQPGRQPRPARPEDFGTVLGASLLTREVRQTAAMTIDEWLLQDPAPFRNLLEATGFRGELALATANTTFLFMPISPGWVMEDEYEPMAEFVASQLSLFRKWELQLKYRMDHLKKIIDTHERLGPDQREVEAAELDLRRLETDIHEERARLRSLSICRSRSYRMFLDALLETSAVAKAEADLDRKLHVVKELHDQVAAMTDDLMRRRERRADWSLNVVILVLAVFGALSWLHDLFQDEPWISGRRGLRFGAFTVGIFLGLLALLWCVSRLKRRTRRSRLEKNHGSRVAPARP
jgi:hypothetical protein